MRQFFKYAFPVFLALVIFASCRKVYETIDIIDDRSVQEYIQKNKLNVKEYKDTGVFYEVVSPGTGPEVEYSDMVAAIITTRTLDGTYASIDTFDVNNRYYNFLGYYNPEAIHVGVKEVLKRSNGTLRMIVPSRLAFGRNGSGNIPGNASLDMTVRVLDVAKINQYDDFSIQKFIQTKSLSGFTKTSSGVYYKIAEPGTGSPITKDSTVVANYTGRLLNGVVFDKAEVGKEATFTLNNLVKGWQEALPFIKEGGKIRLLIPSSLGYGLQGNSPLIPAFSVLDFDVNVTEVKK
jgi:FKBP-type peptidyl-prolyl cis-trans isomerase FkpA